MKIDFRQIVDSSFKIYNNIEDFNQILKKNINGTPKIELSTFLVRSYPIWKSFSKDIWLGYVKKIEDEISLLAWVSFFGMYLKIDLLKTIQKFELNMDEENILYVANYLGKNKSPLYLFKKYKTPEINYYLREEEFIEIRASLLNEGMVELELIPPPQEIRV